LIWLSLIVYFSIISSVFALFPAVKHFTTMIVILQVLRGEAVSTWIFQGWEGLQAVRNGVELNTFPLAGSGVPYGYTPVLLAHPRFCEAGSADAEILKKFLEVSSRGYRHAAQNPAEAAEALLEASKRHPTLVALGHDFLLESARFLAAGGHYLDEAGAWGKMDPARWEQFVEWLFANNCITARDGSVLPR
jgi:ABC-type nitrate/sulfonate/bicarbonate transport system substrate-binding protein